MAQPMTLDGVAWVLVRDGCIALEQCPKKAAKMGFAAGTWFVPGGKIEPGDDGDPRAALAREIGEEWPNATLVEAVALPIVQASPAGALLFLMQPYRVWTRGGLPPISGDGVPVSWFTVEQALRSPVPQVRMMVAAATGAL
jgi:ADP-ribose pyrophosphatase YjhB (NUDIX family)